MEPQNRKYPIILLLAKQNKPKGKISCITVPCIHLSCIHVSVLFISTIGLVRKSRKLSRALLNLRNVGVIWKLNKPKMHQPEEIRLWSDRRLFGKQQSSCRLLHATLQVYSTSFVRSSCVTEEKYLTTNLQTSKSEDWISPAYVWQVCRADINRHARKRFNDLKRYVELY